MSSAQGTTHATPSSTTSEAPRATNIVRPSRATSDAPGATDTLQPLGSMATAPAPLGVPAAIPAAIGAPGAPSPASVAPATIRGTPRAGRTADPHTRGEAPSGRLIAQAADRHDEPTRGRIAIARRGSDDLGLPSLPAPRRGIDAPADVDRRAPELPLAAGHPALDPRSATEPSAAEPSAPAQPSRPLSDARMPAPRQPDNVPPPAVAGAASTRVADVRGNRGSPLRSEPRREINREVRVGDIVVEIGDPLPPRPAVEHAGSLTASIPRPSFQPRRRL
jgi:hypothetical protein